MRSACANVAISIVLGSVVTGCGDHADAPVEPLASPAAPPADTTTSPVDQTKLVDLPIRAGAFDSFSVSAVTGLWCAQGGVCYTVASGAGMLYRFGAGDRALAPEVSMPGDEAFSLSLGAGAIILRTSKGLFSTTDGAGSWSQQTQAPNNLAAFTVGQDGRLYAAANEDWQWGNATHVPIFVNENPSEASAAFRSAGAACRETVHSIAVSASHDIYALVGDETPEVYVMRNGDPLWETLPARANFDDRLFVDGHGDLHVIGTGQSCRWSALAPPQCVKPTLGLYAMTAVLVDSAGTPYMAASDQHDRWNLYVGSYTTEQWRLVAELPQQTVGTNCTDIANDHVGDVVVRCGDRVYRSTP